MILFCLTCPGRSSAVSTGLEQDKPTEDPPEETTQDERFCEPTQEGEGECFCESHDMMCVATLLTCKTDDRPAFTPDKYWSLPLETRAKIDAWTKEHEAELMSQKPPSQGE